MARRLVRTQTGQLYGGAERLIPARERERQLHRSAVGAGTGTLDAEYGIGVPQSPELRVARRIGSKLRHVGEATKSAHGGALERAEQLLD